MYPAPSSVVKVVTGEMIALVTLPSCLCSGAPSLRGRLDGCDAQVRAQWRHRRRHAHQDGTLQKTLIQLTLRKSRLLQLTHRPKVKMLLY